MQKSNNPNVLFIINHDIGRRFGCYGNQAAITPHIDALAKDGTVFEGHYCNYPLCGPSQANIFTGCRPKTTGRFDNYAFFQSFREQMGKDYATLPENFKKNGYFVQSIHEVLHDKDPLSWSVPEWRPEPREIPTWAPEGTPPEEFEKWTNEDSFNLMHDRVKALKEKGYDFKEKQHFKRWRGPATEMGDESQGRYSQEDVTDKVISTLPVLKGNDRPFFLAAGYEIGHTPWCAPKRFWDLYERDQLPQPTVGTAPEESPSHAFGNNEPAQYYTTDCYDRPFMPNEEQSRELLHGAYASMSFFDAQIGLIVKTLEKTGLKENTIVVITADHGIHWGEHGKWGKHNLWDLSFSVPLIIRVPGMGQGKRVQKLTEHVDVYPTLCELCNLNIPTYIEGTSAAPLFTNPDQTWKKAVFAQCHQHRSVRTQKYRYNEYVDDFGKVSDEELYDYQTDPMQRRNVAEDPKYQSVIEEMRLLLKTGPDA